MPKNKKTEWQVGDPTISVVSDQFCNPYPMDLLVKRKVQNFSKDHYEVFDPSGNLLLQVDGQAWGFNRKRTMRDPAGFTILTMRQKGLALKTKWEVHGGESKEREDLLFTVQQSQAVSLKTSVDVFLPENNNVKKTNTCDFHASGGYSNISFKVFKSDALIAGVTHKFTWGSFCKGKYNFKVRVHPEVDYAFIIALLVMVDDNENWC
ncbi:protein LURP-one-related 14 isoform X2 [Capsella rubella]|uniref:protein LURP-one-related 14 isoform X2 n=1 Tax=Capsella rubella TaxID=81985 RepID=UPI000CD49FD5|nr:protein LURP-one-related 14 isoform X2 [Capsella rubella]